MKRVFLKKDRKKNVILRHPWVFSGAIDKIDPTVEPGDIVEICDYSGNGIAKGYINPKSQITIRIMTWEKDENPGDKNFIINRLRSAIDLRIGYFDPSKTNAFRLVNSEADFMPGLIVDKYNDIVVIQILTLGMERFRKIIVEFLKDYLSPKCIYERSDMPIRKKEGLDLKKGVIYGTPVTKQEVIENGHSFLVDIQEGQKTGFYLDQKDNRKELMKFCQGKRILNCFAYTGAFSVYALKGGAEHAVNVEISMPAIKLAKEIMCLNQLRENSQKFIVGDVFDVLRALKEENKRFKSQRKKLKNTLEELRIKERKLAKKKDEEEANIHELVAIIRSRAKDLKGLLDRSIQSAFFKDRVSTLKPIMNKLKFPGIEDMKRMVDIIFQEIRLSGQVRLINGGHFVDRSGKDRKGEVLVIGNFEAIYRIPEEIGFLIYSEHSHQLFALSKLPSRSMIRKLNLYMNGRSDDVPIDLSYHATGRKL